MYINKNSFVLIIFYTSYTSYNNLKPLTMTNMPNLKRGCKNVYVFTAHFIGIVEPMAYILMLYFPYGAFLCF